MSVANAVAVGLLVAAASGCARTRVLVAENGEHRLRAERDAVTVVLTTESWDGSPPDLGQDLSIVHVLVHNQGSAPVLLAPGDFELRDENGFRYELLDSGASFRRADASSSGTYDPGRSTAFGTISSTGPDVGQAALPWGVLEPGTQMRGFLYFQRAIRTANHPTLIWRAQTADHRPLTEFRFPLHVAAMRSR